MTLHSIGKDSTDREATVAMQAITDDGVAHDGAASVTITADTAVDRILMSAGKVQVTKAFQLTGMTTTQRDALTAVNGMLVYNTTDSKFQGYVGGVWVNLH